jgi:hypothetical protein
MRGVTAYDAIFDGTDFSFADLRYTALAPSSAKFATFTGTLLNDANLRFVDLRNANLSDAIIVNTDLYMAKVHGVKWPAPGMVLMAWWGSVNESLTRALMVYDRANHPEPSKFEQWAKTGRCPFDNAKWGRSAFFRERPELWGPSLLKRRPRTALSLAKALIKECCRTKP